MTIWKKNSKWLKQFIRDFSLFIKECYRIVWSVEKIEKVKTQKSNNVRNIRIMLSSKCANVIVKKQDLSKSAKLLH